MFICFRSPFLRSSFGVLKSLSIIFRTAKIQVTLMPKTFELFDIYINHIFTFKKFISISPCCRSCRPSFAPCTISSHGSSVHTLLIDLQNCCKRGAADWCCHRTEENSALYNCTLCGRMKCSFRIWGGECSHSVLFYLNFALEGILTSKHSICSISSIE